MNPESETDRLALLADWGDEVTITPAGGGAPVSLRAIYDAEPRRASLEDDVEYVASQPELLGRSSDLAGIPQQSLVEVTSRPELPAYKVHAIEPDGTRMSRVILLEAT